MPSGVVQNKPCAAIEVALPVCGPWTSAFIFEYIANPSNVQLG